MINIFLETTTLRLLASFLLSDVRLTGTKFSALFMGQKFSRFGIFGAALCHKKVGTATHETRNFMTLVKANLRRELLFFIFRKKFCE